MSPQTHPQENRAIWWLCLWLWLAFTLLFSLTSRARLYGGDDLAYLAIARNWVVFGTPMEGVAPPGLRPSKFPIGQAIVDLPVAKLFHGAMENGVTWRNYALQMLAMGIYQAAWGALQVVVLFLLLRRLRIEHWAAVLTAVLYGVGTQVWPGTQRAYADQTITLMLLIGFWGLLLYRDGGQRRGLAIAASGLGFCLLLKPTTLLFAGVYSVAALCLIRQQAVGSWAGVARRWRELLLWALPLTIGLAALLYYNYWRYGNVTQFGYNEGQDASLGFSMPWYSGVFGLLLSPGKGIVFYNPVVLLGIWGVRAFYRRHLLPALLVLAITLAHLAIYSSWWAWHGDWYWGPRFMGGTIPLLMIPVAFCLVRLRSMCQGWERRLAVAGVAVVALVAICVQLLGTILVNSEYLWMLDNDVHPRIYSRAAWNPPVQALTDAGILRYHVPAFTPFRVYPWMLHVILSESGDWQSVYQNPPWRYLSEELVDEPPGHQPFSLQPWWMHHWHARRPGYRWSLGGAVAMALAMIGAAVMTSRQLRRIRGPSPPAAPDAAGRDQTALPT